MRDDMVLLVNPHAEWWQHDLSPPLEEWFSAAKDPAFAQWLASRPSEFCGSFEQVCQVGGLLRFYKSDREERKERVAALLAGREDPVFAPVHRWARALPVEVCQALEVLACEGVDQLLAALEGDWWPLEDTLRMRDDLENVAHLLRCAGYEMARFEAVVDALDTRLREVTPRGVRGTRSTLPQPWEPDYPFR